MKKLDQPGLNGEMLLSEGKILEITPLLYMPDGTLQSLPPVRYHCPNWLLGYRDDHVQGGPYDGWENWRSVLPGSSSANAVQLSMRWRVYEYQPGVTVEQAELSEEWVKFVSKLFRVELKKSYDEGKKDAGRLL